MLLMLDCKGHLCIDRLRLLIDIVVPSHVLSALGIPVEQIHGTLRFTVGDFTTKEDIDYVVECLAEIVTTLRGISSVNEKKGW